MTSTISSSATVATASQPVLDPVVARVRAACLLMHRSTGPVTAAKLEDVTHCTARQLQRDFQEVLGVSPRQYGQQVRAANARSALSGASAVSDAIYAAGFGSVRAFYEQVAARLGMTPTEYLAGAPDLELLLGVAESGVGQIWAVASARGLCAVRIIPTGGQSDMHAELQTEFPRANLVRDDAAMRDVLAALVTLAQGHAAPALPLHVQGTAFQARVWQALQLIPRGETRSYRDLAQELGDPKAVRAVARACATNPVALTVPCHRVIRSDGSLAGYRWGLEVKRTLLDSEMDQGDSR